MSKGIGEKYLNISIHALREEGDYGICSSS